MACMTMIPSWVISLISTAAGVIIGTFLTYLKDILIEKKQRRRALENLLNDLKFNKKLAAEKRKWGYHTLAYTEAQSSKYLIDFKEEFRNELFDAFIKMFGLNQGIREEKIFGEKNWKPVEKQLEKLEKQLEYLISEIERRLN